MGKLYIVATPIGNLGDITLRALEVLKSVDLVLCEDTRVAQKLLNHFEIKKPLQSYHQHSDSRKTDYIVGILGEGKDVALISDSGTPGISDPGNELVAIINNQLSLINIIPIPGPSAMTAIASVAGIPMDKFVFMGFPPHKKGRQTMFREISESKYPVIIYESVHRIIKTLKELQVFNDFDIVVGRELTKKFETIYRGKISEVIPQIEPRGEFVVIICPNHEK
ncbi:MAG: 16S rRNA (cytidine(1402)-2'-O)-methyltransferase [Patescibacteria group bacterium]